LPLRKGETLTRQGEEIRENACNALLFRLFFNPMITPSLSTPFAKIAQAVIYRLQNPKLRASQRDSLPKNRKGSNGSKSIVGGYTPADGKKSVSFSGFDFSALSETDAHEVNSAVTLALLSAPTDARTLCHSLGLAFRGEMPAEKTAPLAQSADAILHGKCFPCRALVGCVKVSFSHWKQAFTAARATLGIKRMTARESLTVSIDALEEQIKAGQGQDLLAAESIRREAQAEREAEKEERAQSRAAVISEMRAQMQILHAARRSEILTGKRNFRSNFSIQRNHALASFRCVILNQGHGHEKGRTAAYERKATFLEYHEKGVAQLAAENAAAREASARLAYSAQMDCVCFAQ
jgi:hypothetical protein